MAMKKTLYYDTGRKRVLHIATDCVYMLLHFTFSRSPELKFSKIVQITIGLLICLVQYIIIITSLTLLSGINV